MESKKSSVYNRLSIIFGKAGCGKTTYMSTLILKSSDYVVLAATHSAVNTIWNVCNSLARHNKLPLPNSKNFMTIYSFFRINYIDNYILGPIYAPLTIFIDEFSLIDKSLLKECIGKLHKDSRVVICGDPLQLNAIKLEKQFVSINKIKRYQQLMPGIDANVIGHLALNVMGSVNLSKSKLKHRRENLRSNKYVNDVIDNIYSRNDKFDYKFMRFDEFPTYIKNGYVVLASNYNILQSIYTYCFNNLPDITNVQQKVPWKTSGYKQLHLTPNMSLTLCNTDEKKTYFNGETVQLTKITPCGLQCKRQNNTDVIIESVDSKDIFFPVTPSNLLTIHKSQGKGFESVIVCIDDLFHLTMLYTAITRAKTNVVFYTKESDKVKQLFESACIDEFNQLQEYISNVTSK